MPTPSAFFATAPRGLESLLAEELSALGASEVTEKRAGVAFSGLLETAYRACLWSRLASRILLPIARFPAPDAGALYEGAIAVPWEEHLTSDNTFSIDVDSSGSPITHSHFAALRVKDAIVDRFRAIRGERPSVEIKRPDVRVSLHLQKERGTISIDLSGESLHRRGYRERGTAAPLKENLAAALLLRAGWPAVAAEGGELVDPMCGSGTLLIEGALMAGDIAPGLLREYYGFLRWQGHRPATWKRLREEAAERRDNGVRNIPPIRGYDHHPGAVQAAQANVARAGLQGRIEVVRRALAECVPTDVPVGLVIVNPPYGERIGAEEGLINLYTTLGEQLKRCFPGWRAAVFTGNPDLGKHLRLRAHRVHTLYNGPIACKLLHFEIHKTDSTPSQPAARPARIVEPTPGGTMFANRLRKNLKQLGRWAAREDVDCFRLYDADMPEYALAIDLYQGEGGERWLHVQEYQAPKSVAPEPARARLQEALDVIPEVLSLPRERMFVKVRRPQKGRDQYQKLTAKGRFHEVREWNARFWVNFEDYLDTGLFLDHRTTRQMIQRLAKGKRFLNLFCYTGTATVHAALGGASATTSVDLSGTYLEWAERNMALNGFSGGRHRFEQADCMEWLAQPHPERYELIFVDPPTFSNSKRMQGVFDVQRDHVQLIRRAVDILAPGGVLIFSNNYRKFRLDAQALADVTVEDITQETIPKDFERNPKIHRCWRITC